MSNKPQCLWKPCSVLAGYTYVLMDCPGKRSATEKILEIYNFVDLKKFKQTYFHLGIKNLTMTKTTDSDKYLA